MKRKAVRRSREQRQRPRQRGEQDVGVMMSFALLILMALRGFAVKSTECVSMINFHLMKYFHFGFRLFPCPIEFYHHIGLRSCVRPVFNIIVANRTEVMGLDNFPVSVGQHYMCMYVPYLYMYIYWYWHCWYFWLVTIAVKLTTLIYCAILVIVMWLYYYIYISY